jgi:uncharacterized membrane protein SpoIIM required for sporulation
MITSHWLEKREPYWKRLEQIVERSGQRGVSALPYQELQELALLYRQVAADLARVREDPSTLRTSEYLNQLLARAHNLIYMGRRSSSRGAVTFYRSVFPAVFRKNLNYVAFAAVLFAAGAAAGFLVSLADPSFQRFFLGPAMSNTIDHREMWTHSIVAVKPLAASGILTNNLTVAFATFAFSITAGIGTIYLLLTNGLLMGVISAACWHAGMSLQLWEFVAPHGVLELPAIFIAGGAGFLIARGLLFPGSLPRRDALVFYGGQGVRLVLGVIPVLVVAGIVEGFISPSPFPAAVKFVVSGTMAILFFLYLSHAGRSKA